jgi:hypothetical protein
MWIETAAALSRSEKSAGEAILLLFPAIVKKQAYRLQRRRSGEAKCINGEYS